ncbi:hypothetical protein V4E48_004098 [Morganella morganii]|nr:hypothetical protein [Morganella morganii]
MNAYAAQDAQEERRLDSQKPVDEQRVRGSDDYYWRESVGLPNPVTPYEWMEGNFT